MRLIFMGTPDFAVPTLAEIVARGHEVVAVYTRAPKPGGRRGLDLQQTPVALKAQSLGIPVLTPATLRTPEPQAEFAAHRADAAVVVAYGLILPKPVLDAPKRGCFNVHASLLPRWRGAAPINRAIMAGDEETAVDVMKMEEGLDTGPVVLSKRVRIGADETAGELHDRLALLGAEAMAQSLDDLGRGVLAFTPQPVAGVTYAAKIAKDETRIDWSKPWSEVHNHCRGLAPVPGAWFEYQQDGKPVRVKVLRTTRGEGSGTPGAVLDDRLTIACGGGAVRLVQVQRAGSKAMPADEFLRGSPLTRGTQLPRTM